MFEHTEQYRDIEEAEAMAEFERTFGEDEEAAALNDLEVVQRSDLVGVLEAMAPHPGFWSISFEGSTIMSTCRGREAISCTTTVSDLDSTSHNPCSRQNPW